MEGGGGRGWRRQRCWRRRVALYPHCIITVSPLYPHCILTVFLQREVSAESCGGGSWWVVVVAAVEGVGGGGWRRQRVAEAEGGGGGGWRCILTVSSLYPHCILTVSSLYPHCIPPKRGVCGVLRRGKVEGGGW